MDAICLPACAARLAQELVRHPTKETHRIWQLLEPRERRVSNTDTEKKRTRSNPSPIVLARVLAVFERCPQLVR